MASRSNSLFDGELDELDIQVNTGTTLDQRQALAEAADTSHMNKSNTTPP
jgi:hypothetical protein